VDIKQKTQEILQKRDNFLVLIDQSINEVRSRNNQHQSLSTYVANEFRITDINSLSEADLQRILEICLLGRKLGESLNEAELNGESNQSLPEWTDPISRTRDLFFEIEAHCIVDLKIDPVQILSIQGDAFKLEKFKKIVQLLVSQNQTDDIIVINKGSGNHVSNPVNTDLDMNFDYVEFKNSEQMFTIDFSRGQFTTKVNNLHPWNQLMSENIIAMNAFYNALATALPRLDHDTKESVDSFMRELSIYLERYAHKASNEYPRGRNNNRS